MRNISLKSAQTREDLLRIQNISTPSDITIVLGTLNEVPQTLFLPANISSNASAATPTNPMSRGGSTSLPTRISPNDETVGNAIYTWGSNTKPWIAYALCRFVEQTPGLDLDKAADTVFNGFARTGTPKIKLPGNPSLRQLLCHVNGFAPMNKILFAPEGTFMLTKEEFLKIAPDFTDTYYRKGSKWFDYSNANYIFVGILLEEAMGKTLQVVLQKLVFDKLGISSTAVDLDSVDGFNDASRLVKGFQISSAGVPVEVNAKTFLKDTTESASMGIRSSINDFCTFNMELLRGRHSESGLGAHEHSVNLFRGNDISFAGFVSHPVYGEFKCETPTAYLYPGRGSLLDLGQYEPKPLGKQVLTKDDRAHYNSVTDRLEDRSGPLVFSSVTHKAGYIDGSSSNVIFFEQNRFLVIHANSTGPFDVVHHMSRYFLQEMLELQPRIDIEEAARTDDKNCRKTLQRLEERNLARCRVLHKPGELVGTYKHTKWGHEIVLHADGGVVFRRQKKSRVMRLTFVKHNIVRILIEGEVLPIDGWSTWKNLDFKVEQRDYSVCLVQENETHEDDIFRRVDT